MKYSTALASVLWILPLTACVRAADWPCYLGPNRNLISPEKGLKLWSGDAARVLWKKNVGQGHSSVVVVGKHLYTQGAATVWCLETETGKVVWAHPPLTGDPGKGEETTATPAVAAGQVFALNSDGKLLGLDAASGQLQWSRSVSEFGVKAGGWPLSGSPFALEDKVVMDLGVVFVLNRKTGDLITQMGTETAGYSSAVIFPHGNEKLVTAFDAAGLTIYWLAGGPAVARFSWETAHGVNAATPVVSGDGIFISSGYDRGCARLKLEGNTLKKVWEYRQLNNHCQTSVLYEGHLYGMHGQQGQRSSLKCLDFETGATKWEQKGLRVGGGLTLADGELFVMLDGGDLLVAQASPAAFKQLARATVLSGTCWTVPVVADGRVYCRNQQGDLVAVDLR